MLTEKDIWNCLSEIPDPDIPVVSITELGLVRNVDAGHGEKITISITPSYSGCPAMQYFREEIIIALKNKGAKEVEVKTIYSPPWTTDWISDAAKEKMKTHGIAPPEPASDGKAALFSESRRQVGCPWCSSTETTLTSQFGSTPCKALWFCNSCSQPFEYFKCL